MMGVTKRLGELYSQALDLDSAGRDGGARFMTVRFGNVLGSSGSFIPLFQRQLSRHGPLTVPHQDIERYFMTVRSEEPRVGKAWFSTCRSRGSPYHEKKKPQNHRSNK